MTGADALANPLAAGDGNAPPPPPPESDEAPRSNPKSTSRLITRGLSTACTLSGMPLSEREAEAFEHDLRVVLAKHNVASLPYEEEANLLGTTLEIVVPRVLYKLQGGSTGGSEGDNSQHRQEGQRQEHAPTEAGLENPAAASEVADVLS